MTREQETRALITVWGLGFAAMLVLVALVSGCAGLLTGAKPKREMPHEAEAMALAWKYFGRSDGLPKIYYLEADRLTCRAANGRRGIYTGWMKDGKPVCGSGVTYDAWSFAIVLESPDQKLAETSLCHEARHCALARQLIFDPTHSLPDWDEKESECRELLRRAGY